MIIRICTKLYFLGQRFAMMEEKIVLASIVRNFNIKSIQITEDIRITPEIILKSTNGIMVELQRRKHT
jgi:cytochrome P450